MKEQFTINKLKLITYIFFLIFFSQNFSFGFENKIIFKINNDIITSIEIINEEKYLKALNPKLQALNNKEIFEISKKSRLNEKIKEIEINKSFENPELPKEYLEQLMRNIYSRININNLEEFKDYLKSNQIDYNYVVKKIEIEALWNELIIKKFSSKIKLDKDELRKKVLQNKDKISKSYLLSEIFFNVGETETYKKKYKEINNIIINKGFENAALKYSNSQTSSLGGKLGWIDENSLNEKIKNKLNITKNNSVTDPIQIPGGFLILKIEDIKTTKIPINIDEELKKIIRSVKNNQLNQFSKLYFNKIKKDILINEI